MKSLKWPLMAVLLGSVACGSTSGDRSIDPGPTGTSNNPAGAGGNSQTGSNGSGVNGSGASGSDAGTSGSDDDASGICKEFAVRAAPTTPDMLIVLDRSGSMKRDNVNRWDPSVSALKSVTSKLEAKVRFGLMLFPGTCAPTDLACLINSSCKPGTLDVPVALNNAANISTALNQTPLGGTPTGASLEEALKALGGTQVNPDEAVAPKFVLLVSDGQPTCPSGNGMNVNQADIDQSTKAVDALRAAGVKTYVIGYDTKNDASLASVLDEFAMHGGTGQHRAVEDEATLLAEFDKIAGEVVSCSYQLDMEPPDPSYVLIQLDGKQLNLDDPNGWSINGKAVTLQGTACSTLQNGQNHTVNVQVLCQVVDPV